MRDVVLQQRTELATSNQGMIKGLDQTGEIKKSMGICDDLT
jgi:hypothetical protein